MQGQAWTSLFRHPEGDFMLLVHGDDFLVLGDEDGQNILRIHYCRKNTSFVVMVALDRKTINT